MTSIIIRVHLYEILTYIMNTCKGVGVVIRKLNKRNKHKNKIIFFSFILIMIVLFISILENNLKPTIKAVAESKANLIATEVINKVIYEDVLRYVEYNDLVNIHKDNQNRITLIQANSIRISKLISETSLKIKEKLTALSGEAFEIPLGQALGSYIFAAYGPPIKVKILPVGEIDVQLYQNFQEAGINQTRHLLYLDTKVSVKVVVPMATEKVTVNTKVPIAETIVVGTVPDTVVRFDGTESFLKGSLYKGLNSLK